MSTETIDRTAAGECGEVETAQVICTQADDCRKADGCAHGRPHAFDAERCAGGARCWDFGSGGPYMWCSPEALDFWIWATQVRDPAKQDSEGLRVLHRGAAKLEYELAEIERGWAWTGALYVGHAGSHTPWCHAPLPTRAAALDEMLRWGRGQLRAIQRTDSQCEDVHRDARALELRLEPGLWGFQEPLLKEGRERC